MEDFDAESDGEEFHPLARLKKQRRLRKKFGYLDQELRKSLTVNKAVKVIHNVPFESDCYGINSVKYSPYGNVIAAGCGNGNITIVNTTSGDVTSTIKDLNSGEITAIKFIPTNPDYLVTSTQGGKVFVCDVHSPKFKLKMLCAENRNEIYSLDVSNETTTFVTGGKDATIRIYDARTKKMTQTYGGKDTCHQMKICCVLFYPKSPYLFVTGGWDNCVKLWDIRTNAKDPIRNFKGPQIHGDAIDFNGNKMLTGSCTIADSIKIWDLTSGKIIETVRPANILSSLEGEYYTCVKYYKNDPSGNIILTAGRGRCALDAIDVNEMKILVSVRMKKFVKTLDSLEYIAMGGHEPVLKIVELPLEKHWVDNIEESSSSSL